LSLWIFFSTVVGFELRALCLLGKCSTSWAMPTGMIQHTWFIYWGGSDCLFAWDALEPQSLDHCLQSRWDYRYEPPCWAFEFL
jgi:hypothetical protein